MGRVRGRVREARAGARERVMAVLRPLGVQVSDGRLRHPRWHWNLSNFRLRKLSTPAKLMGTLGKLSQLRKDCADSSALHEYLA